MKNTVIISVHREVAEIWQNLTEAAFVWGGTTPSLAHLFWAGETGDAETRHLDTISTDNYWRRHLVRYQLTVGFARLKCCNTRWSCSDTAAAVTDNDSLNDNAHNQQAYHSHSVLVFISYLRPCYLNIIFCRYLSSWTVYKLNVNYTARETFLFLSYIHISFSDVTGNTMWLKKVSCCTVSTAYFFEPPCILVC